MKDIEITGIYIKMGKTEDKVSVEDGRKVSGT